MLPGTTMTTIDAALFSSSLASDAAEVFGTGPVISLTCCYDLLFHLTQSYCISIFTQPYSEFIGPGVSTLLLHFCSCFWQNLMMFFQVEIKKQPGATLAGLFGNSRILSRQQTTCRLKHRTVQNSWARRRQFSWNQTEAAKNRVDQ